MKRWQVEQIFYLNDIGKEKLALPQAHRYMWQEEVNFIKKESIVLATVRWIVDFFIKVF